MRSLGIVTVDPGLEVRTAGTPWGFRCSFTVSPWRPPTVKYHLLYGGSLVTAAADEWCPVSPGQERLVMAGVRHWVLDDVLEHLLERLRVREAPEPPHGDLRAFLAASRRSMMEAHLARVAEQLSDEFSSDEAARIWGEEDVRRVMVS